MQDYIIDRVINEAIYILKTKETVRDMSSVFSVSKSTIHKDLAHRLCEIDSCLYDDVREILNQHKLERHIRGGKATCEKYRLLREQALNKDNKKNNKNKQTKRLWF